MARQPVQCLSQPAQTDAHDLPTFDQRAAKELAIANDIDNKPMIGCVQRPQCCQVPVAGLHASVRLNMARAARHTQQVGRYARWQTGTPPISVEPLSGKILGLCDDSLIVILIDRVLRFVFQGDNAMPFDLPSVTKMDDRNILNRVMPVQFLGHHDR